jgi:hypothetical protein
MTAVCPAILGGGERPELKLLVPCTELAVAELEECEGEQVFPGIS